MKLKKKKWKQIKVSSRWKQSIALKNIYGILPALMCPYRIISREN